MEKKYEANTKSLSQYEVPEWYKDAKLGIFIHYGIYSVPGFGDEWYGHWLYIPNTKSYGGSDIYTYHLNKYGGAKVFGYKDFIPVFNQELQKFSQNKMAEKWAELFHKAGAHYVMPVGIHHDSFALFKSDVQKIYNSVTQSGVDYIGELQSAVKNKGMKFGISNHFAENDWFFDETYGKGTDMVDPAYSELYGTGGNKTQSHVEKWYAIQSEITNKYKPDLIYFDFDLVNKAFNTYPVSNRYQMLADYYNMALDHDLKVVCNFKDGAFTKAEAVLDKEREALPYISPTYWQSDTSIGRKSWGYTTDDEYRSASELISGLVDIVSKNGNLLLNVGPKADGTIPVEIENTLLEMGSWLGQFGDAIYSTRPWLVYGEGTTFNSGDSYTYKNTDIRFTKSKDDTKLFVTALAAPTKEKMVIQTLMSGNWDASNIESVSLLNGSERIPVDYKQTENGLEITIPNYESIHAAYSVEISFNGKIPPVPTPASGTTQPCNGYELKNMDIMTSRLDGSPIILNTQDGAYAKYLLKTNKGVIDRFSVDLSSDSEGKIVIRQNSTTGKIIGTLNVKSTNSYGNDYRRFNTLIDASELNGQFDLCLIFYGNIMMKEFQFMELRTLNVRIEAENFDEKEGTVHPEPTKDTDGGGENIGYVSSGDWVKYNDIDFKTGCTKLIMRLAGTGQSFKVRIDSTTGPIIALSGPINTGSWGTYKNFEFIISEVTGKHDVYITFDGACNINWFEFR